MAPTTLKTKSIVSPKILKGKRISQIRGKRKRTIRATGQQMTRRIHHSTSERKKLMIQFSGGRQKVCQIANVRLDVIFESEKDGIIRFRTCRCTFLGAGFWVLASGANYSLGALIEICSYTDTITCRAKYSDACLYQKNNHQCEGSFWGNNNCKGYTLKPFGTRGNVYNRFPVALTIALRIAGAMPKMGASPAPADGMSVRLTITVSSTGTSLKRGTR